jgi:GT2 family glycosyltransferase
MLEGEIFNVVVSKGPGEAVFIHRATPENTVENHTYVNHSQANKNPDAVVLVTPNWNPGGGAGTYSDHLVGVRYDVGEQKWAILNQDLVSMPEGVAFDVAVSDGTKTVR